MKICLVVPCYNEENRICLSSFEDFIKAHSNTHIVFVDDGSTDKTYDLLVQFKKKQNSSNIQLLKLDQNSGKGEACRSGLLFAIQEKFEFVGYWDADLATPLEELLAFQKMMLSDSEICMILGTRVKLLGREIHRNMLRHYLGRCFATAASIVLNLPVYDTQCGAKLLRVDANLIEALKQPFKSKWLFDVELIARLLSHQPHYQHKMKELPLHVWRDIPGSKVKPRHFFIAFFDLLKIYAQKRKS